MKFNVGDKVRIKEDLSQCKFGSNAYMEEYAGKEATVVQTFGEGMIILDVDEQDWNWSEEVLEKIEGDNKVKMKRIDYIMNSKNPIKVLAEKFKLELECYECPHNDRYGKCDSNNCKEGLREYLEQEIEVNESNLKKINTEPTIDISVKATDEQIDTKEALQKALDEVREQLLKTKDKVIDMKEESVENDPVNPFMEEYKKIVTDTMELCIAKNKDYGSSVQDTYERFGDISYLVRITDKYNRICTLLDKEAEVKDENIDDTIKDMGNYLFLWLASRRLNNKGENNE